MILALFLSDFIFCESRNGDKFDFCLFFLGAEREEKWKKNDKKIKSQKKKFFNKTEKLCWHPSIKSPLRLQNVKHTHFFGCSFWFHMVLSNANIKTACAFGDITARVQEICASFFAPH